MSIEDEIQRILSRAHAEDALEPILAIVRAHRDRLADRMKANASEYHTAAELAVRQGFDSVATSYRASELMLLNAASQVRALYEEQPK